MRQNWELLTEIDSAEDNDPELEDRQFELVSDFEPQGDQPQAIDMLTNGLQRGDKGADAAGCYRFWQNLHDGESHPERPVAHARDFAQ